MKAKYCKKCVYPYYAVALEVAEDGICSSCKSFERSETLTDIFWEDRKKRLDDIFKETLNENIDKIKELWKS